MCKEFHQQNPPARQTESSAGKIDLFQRLANDPLRETLKIPLPNDRRKEQINNARF
jgi:hypothetical protein